MDTEIPDAEAVIGQHWPLYGPFDHDRSRTAAQLLAEVVRYLHHASANRAAALPYASSVYDVVGSLAGAAASLDQVLGQLSARCAELASDPTLYDHDQRGNHALAVERAEMAREQLAVAAQAAASLHAALGAAHNHLGHLGHRDA
jgi:hypothetical protein